MKNQIFTLFLVICCAFSAKSQNDYKTAIGFRVGYPASVSFKWFVTSPGALEAFVGLRPGIYTGYITAIGVMYQHHVPIVPIKGLKGYAGIGAGPFISTYRYHRIGYVDSWSLGIIGGIGFDYKFANAPINLSIDWTPVYNIGTELASGRTVAGFLVDHAALSVRYTFGKREKAADNVRL